MKMNASLELSFLILIKPRFEDESFFEEGEDDMSKMGANPFKFIKTFLERFEDFVIWIFNFLCLNFVHGSL